MVIWFLKNFQECKRGSVTFQNGFFNAVLFVSRAESVLLLEAVHFIEVTEIALKIMQYHL